MRELFDAQIETEMFQFQTRGMRDKNNFQLDL